MIPAARPPFTDGWNSASHFALGYVFAGRLLLPFLAYQILIKPDANSPVDTAEYLLGWLARSWEKKHAEAPLRII